MITETRKQIIDIIGDYMDKTLSFGCVYNYDGIYDFILDLHDTKGVFGLKFSGFYDDRLESDSKFKIIGHYDITAVLKYIDSKTIGHLNISVDKNDLNISYNFTEGYNNDSGFLINKPINQYTEQEDKDLLELLQKLGS